MSVKSSESKRAVKSTLPDSLIVCQICQKTLKTPKCLPCLHTMCLRCLHGHIMATAPGKTSFLCPVCGENTLPPIEEVKEEEWAKLFPSNPVIDSVMGAMELQQGDRKCDPCRGTRKRSLAATWCSSCREALCASCSSVHRGMRLTRHHELYDISDIGSQPIAAILKEEKCPDHADQFMTFFCRDHRQPCCPTCAVAIHRRCDNVQETAKLGKELRAMEKPDKLLKRLKACIETQERTVSLRKESRNDLVSMKNGTLKEIRDLKTKIVELLNEMEIVFLREFDMLYKTNEAELDTSITEGNRVLETMNNTKAMLEASMKHASDSQLFTSFEIIQEECNRYETIATETDKDTLAIAYNFKMDERLLHIANAVKKFGHLSIENDNIGRKPLNESSVRETKIFSAKLPFDDLRGVDIFQNGDIIIADRTTKSVLLFQSSAEFVSHLNFQSRPWGVACIGVRSACVSLPDICEIRILQVANKVIKSIKTINTGVSCFALTNFAEEYLAIQHSTKKENKGKVTLAKSDQQSYHKHMFDITANHDHIQV